VTPKPPSDNRQKCLGFQFQKQLPETLKKIQRAAQFKKGRILMMMIQGLAIQQHHPTLRKQMFMFVTQFEVTRCFT